MISGVQRWWFRSPMPFTSRYSKMRHHPPRISRFQIQMKKTIDTPTIPNYICVYIYIYGTYIHTIIYIYIHTAHIISYHFISYHISYHIIRWNHGIHLLTIISTYMNTIYTTLFDTHHVTSWNHGHWIVFFVLFGLKPQWLSYVAATGHEWRGSCAMSMAKAQLGWHGNNGGLAPTHPAKLR